MPLIDTPGRFFVLISLIFSLLIGLAAFGTTYNILYGDDDKRYRNREAFRSGVLMFVILMLVLLVLIFLFPKFIKD